MPSTKMRFFLIGMILFWVGIFTFIRYRIKSYENRILPNIFVEHIAIGGLTKPEANKLLLKVYATKNTQPTITFLADKNPIATLSAQNIHYQIPIKPVVDQAFTIGKEVHNLSSLYQFLSLNLSFQEYNFPLHVEYDQQTIDNFLHQINEAYRKNPKDARFEFVDGRVTVFDQEKSGYQFNLEKAKEELSDVLNQLDSRKALNIPLALETVILKPKIALKNINNLGIVEHVATGNSTFRGSAPERVHNITTGASKLNGIIIKSGEVFSFVEAIGDISSATGFRPAYVIKSGRTVLDDGGGICQVSTTLFRAALNAGLKIIERHAHAYRVGYYEQDSKPGFDATIYSPSVDLKFRNNYGHAILIQAVIDPVNYTLSFNVYGQKDGRVVEISDAIVWNEMAPPPAEYIDDPTLPIGVTRQVDFPAWGASTKFSYKVIRNESILDEQEFVSHFKPWKAIYMVGRK